MTPIFTWALALLGGGSAFGGVIYLIAKGVKDWEREKQEREEFENTIQAEHQGRQEMANMPVTASDAAKRLRDRAAYKAD